MQWQEYIECNPGILSGKPVIKGTRLPVALIIQKLENGYSFDELQQAYPHLTKDQLLAVFEFADSGQL
jgi:uncharacterized protein (DUF433 family)